MGQHEQTASRGAVGHFGQAAECVFCRILAGEIPTQIVASNEHAVAFADINPKATIHLLIIPKEHHPNLAAVASEQPEAALAMINLAAQIVQDQQLGDYRLGANTGARAGQSVFHAHLHLLAGKQMAWPVA